MRQVNRDELIYTIADAMRGFTPALFRDLSVNQHKTRARVIMAAIVADSLAKFEVLSERDLPAIMGEAMFSQPVARMLGEDVPSGVSYVEVEPTQAKRYAPDNRVDEASAAEDQV